MNKDKILKIKNSSEEYYYNSIHTVKLEGSTRETVYWVNFIYRITTIKTNSDYRYWQ